MKIIHVNQQVIRHNKKYGNKLPAIRVEDTETKDVVYCMEAEMSDGRLVYQPDNPRPCGAKLWIEVHGPVKMIGRVPYSKIRKRMEKLSASILSNRAT